MHLQLWVEALGAAEAETLMRGYRASLAKTPNKGRGWCPRRFGNAMKNRSTKLSYRVTLGREMDNWLNTSEGRQAVKEKRQWSAVALHLQMRREGEPHSQHVKSFLKRCYRQYREGARPSQQKDQTYRAKPGWFEVPAEVRCRAKGVQGKPAKTAELSNALYQWFVDHRMTIAGRLGTRQVLAMARSMMLTLSLASVSDDVVPEPPQLSYKWLSRWRHVWGVSFRKPTKRFKVRRSILKQRLLIYWSNLLALRWFMKLLWNKEPLHEQYDQKGVHYNEAGSKQMPTYELPGRRDPPIRENHAQTRERVSWMTCTWSNLAAAGRPIPLEMLFKAKGKNVLKALRVPDAQR